jgi:EmrB/QacA subfamily drug resistance transporter
MNTSNTQRKWWALIGLGLALAIVNLDMTIVNLTLPILGEQFKANMATLQWINNIYSLSVAALVILTGKLADQYGQRTTFLCGISLFFLGSLIASISPDVNGIILGRLFQGIGMAATFGMIFVLVTQAFPEHQHGLAVSMLIIFTGVAQAIGPSAGGFIVQHWGWRWAFLINLPLCVISFIFVRFACHKDQGKQSLNIHYPSAALFSLALFLMIWAFNQCEQWGLNSPLFYVILGTGLALFFWLCHLQKKLTHPFLDKSLYSHKTYLAISCIRPFFQFNFGAFLFILPLYLQNVRGDTPSQCGLTLLMMTVFVAVASPIAGKLNDRFGPERPIITAHLLSCIGFGSLLLAPAPIHGIPFAIGLVCIGANIGIMFSSTNYAAVRSAPAHKKGVGFGTFTAIIFFAHSLGVSFAGYLLSAVSQSHFLSQLKTQSWTLGAHNIKDINPFINGAHPLKSIVTLAPAHAQGIIGLAQHAFDFAFRTSIALMLLFSVIGLLLSLKFLGLGKQTTTS